MKLFIFLSLFISSTTALAQISEKQKPGYEVGAFLGNFLPNQIDGVTEITPLSGLRLTLSNASADTYYEIGVMTGRAYDVEWTNAFLSIAIRYPIESITGIFYIGGDYHGYKTSVDAPLQSMGGGHIGGALMTNIRNSLFFRSDMKFNINPGTSLYFGFSFVFFIPSSGDKEAQP
ncbi:MAG: hypothetical protein D6797_07610 [Bdellovibrio sp.]|nr:MAG: hypothetical protein D6797_07610 [Bdellovibrio sp.]